MTLIKPADGVTFAEDELEQAFLSLANNSPLKNSINKAIKDLKENVFCGEQIKKERIPKEYIKKYKINNLWWFPLSDAWRLVYSVVTPTNIEILAVIIDYYNHKNYEKKFGYK
jgi:Txe/YoeB family toxin of Txe-Axe toxin-antitoxin module